METRGIPDVYQAVNCSVRGPAALIDRKSFLMYIFGTLLRILEWFSCHRFCYGGMRHSPAFQTSDILRLIT